MDSATADEFVLNLIENDKTREHRTDDEQTNEMNFAFCMCVAWNELGQNVSFASVSGI